MKLSSTQNKPALQKWAYSLEGTLMNQEDPLEKEIAIHSNILTWEIPWTVGSGRLQSMGPQKVGHD